jgi:hypothetical protein
MTHANQLRAPHWCYHEQDEKEDALLIKVEQGQNIRDNDDDDDDEMIMTPPFPLCQQVRRVYATFNTEQGQRKCLEAMFTGFGQTLLCGFKLGCLSNPDAVFR